MKKTTLLATVGISLLLVIGLVVYFKKSSPKPTTQVDNTEVDLPINTIPLSERPFITLTPDNTGRSLNISIASAPKSGSMEYEMIYNASGKQEGALGSISLGSEKEPIIKSILLGSRSAGGATTYHEGVTGGSITLTYGLPAPAGDTRLKESWNYLHFDPSDPTISSTDARFHATLAKTALKKDSVIVAMKTFGYVKTGLPSDTIKVVAGPYGYFAQTEIKGSASIEIKLPAGEYVNPTIYEFQGSSWKKLPTKLASDTVTATGTGSVFLVTAD